MVADRMPAWRPGLPPQAPQDISHLDRALSFDFVEEARTWFPAMTDQLATDVLSRAAQLSSLVGHATAVVALAGALGVVSGGLATGGAVIGAVAYCALTFAPAATATVLRAARATSSEVTARCRATAKRPSPPASSTSCRKPSPRACKPWETCLAPGPAAAA